MSRRHRHSDERNVGFSPPGGGFASAVPPSVFSSFARLPRDGGWPASAAEFATACRHNIVVDFGWLLDEPSTGNCAPVFGPGATPLVPANTPTQGVAGPLGDRALRTADASTQAALAAILDAAAGDDIVLAGVSKFTAAAATRHVVGRRGAAAAGYHVQISSSGVITLVITDATNSVIASAAAVNHLTGTPWVVWMAALERGAVNQGRICSSIATGSAVSPTPGALGSPSNATTFGLGRPASTTCGADHAALWAGVGPDKAKGVIAAMPTLVANLKAYIGLP